MKRVLALLLVLTLLLTACHGKKAVTAEETAVEETAAAAETGAAEASGSETEAAAEETEAPEETASAAAAIADWDDSKPVTITFWAKNDTNKAQVAIYKQAIEDFTALYPNVTVNLKLYTDYSKLYNDVITNIATDTTPNVCITYPDHIATYLTGTDIVTDLTPYFEDSRYGFGGSELRYDGPLQEEVVSQFLSECMIDGSYYAVPYMRSTEACYVNKDFVEALGYELPETLTWDFIWEVSEKAMEKNADGTFKLNGQNVLIPFIYKSTDNMMIQMLKQKNAGYSTDDGSIRIFNDTTRELLLTIAEHAGTRAFSTFKISSYPANFLNAGQCIFAIDSTAGSTWMGSDAPLLDISEDQLVKFETAVMTVPQYDTENPQMISQGPSICVFNKSDSQEVLASWLFTQYLLTNDVQIAYAETEGYVPVTTKAQTDPAYTDYLSRAGEDNSTYYDVKIAATQLLIDHTEDTFVTPVFNGSASLRDAAGQMIENVTKSMRRGETVDDAYLDTLFDSVTSMYHLNQGGLVIEEESGTEASAETAETAADTKTQSGSQTAKTAKTSSTSGKADLGPLPGTAVALLSVLAAAWVLIGAYALYNYVKGKNRQKKG